MKLYISNTTNIDKEPAAFGRLCVETIVSRYFFDDKNPAAFGRLCVETRVKDDDNETVETSRLRAAVC